MRCAHRVPDFSCGVVITDRTSGPKHILRRTDIAGCSQWGQRLFIVASPRNRAGPGFAQRVLTRPLRDPGHVADTPSVRHMDPGYVADTLSVRDSSQCEGPGWDGVPGAFCVFGTRCVGPGCGPSGDAWARSAVVTVCESIVARRAARPGLGGRDYNQGGISPAGWPVGLIVRRRVACHQALPAGELVLSIDSKRLQPILEVYGE